MTKEALKLALDALEDIGDEWGFTSQRTVPKRKEALTAIKEALAQPEQEPVVFWDGESRFVSQKTKEWDKRTGGTLGFGCDIALYTTPPQRTWVGLTDKDWNRSKHNYDFQKGVDWAESILKEKNT